ncbi:hypothetical protein [Streptomyces scabiei]|uniref:hypothetical protein n=1 Tax=Streptomyces scabiei TaxID=1930 RepID=UPI0037AABF7D
MRTAVKRAAARRSLAHTQSGRMAIEQYRDSLSWPSDGEGWTREDRAYVIQYRSWDRREVTLQLRKHERFLFDR